MKYCIKTGKSAAPCKKLLIISILILFLACLGMAQRQSPPAVNAKISGTHLINFSGQINRSAFKSLNDADVAPYLAADFVWDIRHFTNNDEFQKMKSLLRKLNPKMIIGSYGSACTALPSQKDSFPPAKMPLEDCKTEWFLLDKAGNRIEYNNEDQRYFLDMRREDVRQAIIKLAITRAKKNGLDALCFDNCYWGIVPFKQTNLTAKEWTEAFMKFFEEAGKAAHKEGLKCFVNVAMYPANIPSAFAAMAPYLDGFMTEVAFHPIMREPKNVQSELQGYENVLKQGKTVLLFPRNNEDLDFVIKSITPLARKYGTIYVSLKGKIKANPAFRISRDATNPVSDSNDKTKI